MLVTRNWPGTAVGATVTSVTLLLTAVKMPLYPVSEAVNVAVVVQPEPCADKSNPVVLGGLRMIAPEGATGVAVGTGVGVGVEVGTGVAVGSGVAVGRGVVVGVADGNGVAVATGVTVGAGVALALEAGLGVGVAGVARPVSKCGGSAPPP